jgi:hypothetical protein
VDVCFAKVCRNQRRGTRDKNVRCFGNSSEKLVQIPTLQPWSFDQTTSGYAAAGVLPWRRCSPKSGGVHADSDDGGATRAGELEFLLTREYRPTSRDTAGDKLNFLGGKRLKSETEALTCAVDKVHQETSGQLSPATMARMSDGGFSLVYWSSESKYALFLFEIVEESDRGVDERCAGLPGAKRLEWVTRKELQDSTWIRREMHPYALEMLEKLTSCSIMRRLEELFDVAAASTTVSASDDQALNSGKTPVQVETSTIRACQGDAALPDQVPSLR